MQTDDDLTRFAAQGAPPLPPGSRQGFVEHDGAHIWYAAYGAAPTLILLHGGLGHSGNWGYQLPALLAAGYGVLVIDSRGHGRSTRDARPYRYARMADDLLAVMDALQIPHAALAGWSDGACVALIAAHRAPERVDGVFFFGCNMDASGVKPPPSSLLVERCFARHAQDYAALSPTPEDFAPFVAAVSLMMSSQPNYTAQELAAIRVPVTVAHSEHDEFIRAEHAVYLSHSIPGARLVTLPGVSHFAPLQRPALFNRALLDFLADVMCRLRVDARCSMLEAGHFGIIEEDIMSESIVVRSLEQRDFAAWLALWQGYNAFYGREGATALPDEVTQTTWRRFFDAYEPMYALVAEHQGQVVGLTHYLLHRSTIQLQPNCYLQDLFTAEAVRGKGGARALIAAVYERAQQLGLPRVYWNTHETNQIAMRLYDKVAERPGFVMYRKAF